MSYSINCFHFPVESLIFLTTFAITHPTVIAACDASAMINLHCIANIIDQ